MLEEEAPRHGTDRDGKAGDAGPDGDGAAALLALEDVRDQRQRPRHDERAADAHERACGDELTRRGRHGREQRADSEHTQSHLQRAAPAETVAEAAGRQQQPGEHQRVRVDHPLELTRRCVEPALTHGPRQRRQGHVQDRVVDDDDEEAEAEDPEDPPPPLVHRVAHGPAFRDEGWRSRVCNAAGYETHPSRIECDEGLSPIRP